jgi:hypothetical protein
MEKVFTINKVVEDLEDIKLHLTKLEKITLGETLTNDVLELRRRVGVIGAQIHQLQSVK